MTGVEPAHGSVARRAFADLRVVMEGLEGSGSEWSRKKRRGGVFLPDHKSSLGGCGSSYHLSKRNDCDDEGIHERTINKLFTIRDYVQNLISRWLFRRKYPLVTFAPYFSPLSGRPHIR